MMISRNGNSIFPDKLDETKLNRMKYKIIWAEKENLTTGRYSFDEMVERIRKIIEKEAK